MPEIPKTEPTDDENAEFYFRQSRRLVAGDEFRQQCAFTGAGIGCLMGLVLPGILFAAGGGGILALLAGFVHPIGWLSGFMGLGLGTISGMAIASIFDKYRIVRSKPEEKSKKKL